MKTWKTFYVVFLGLGLPVNCNSSMHVDDHWFVTISSLFSTSMWLAEIWKRQFSSVVRVNSVLNILGLTLSMECHQKWNVTRPQEWHHANIIWELMSPYLRPIMSTQKSESDDRIMHVTGWVTIFFLEQNNISVIPCPTFLPHLSPIDHLYDQLEWHLSRCTFSLTNHQNLEQWAEHPPGQYEMCDVLDKKVFCIFFYSATSLALIRQ